MRFLPHTPSDIATMLAAIGVDGIDALFEDVPAGLRERAGLDLPAGLGERELYAELAALAERNEVLPSFQGAGCYRHFVPAVVSQVMARAEFATAYTPYQPEVSQGTLQVTFEFQTYVARLTGLEVANASMYDGASAFAEALLMALRLKRKRNRLLVSAGVHPEYLAVARTYMRGFGDGVVTCVPLGADGRTDIDALESLLDEDVAAVALGYPNAVGVVDDLSSAARLARRVGALTISATAEPLSLALLRAPGEIGADIAVAEGQSFGLPVSYGGPGVGLLATRQAHVRQMPGRLVGETVDEHGRRGYVLTLATREQHIRREKATSNICTNQGLAALCVTVYLSMAGRRGLRALAVENTVAAHELARRLGDEAGLVPATSAPFFNEFAVKVPGLADWFARTVAEGVVPGVPLERLYPDEKRWHDCLLVTVTECTAPAHVDRLVELSAREEAA